MGTRLFHFALSLPHRLAKRLARRLGAALEAAIGQVRGPGWPHRIPVPVRLSARGPGAGRHRRRS